MSSLLLAVLRLELVYARFRCIFGAREREAGFIGRELREEARCFEGRSR